MSLSDQIVTDVTAVFLNTDDFAETVVHWPKGDSVDAVDVTALVDRDDETLQDKQGNDLQDQHGRRTPRKLVLEVAATIATDDRDKWVVDGEVWSHRRIEGRDGGLKAILCWKPEPNRTRSPRIRR